MGRGKGNTDKKGKQGEMGLNELKTWYQESRGEAENKGGERLEKNSQKGMLNVGKKGTGKAFVRMQMHFEGRWLNFHGVMTDVDCRHLH